jgi:hypothetical protein
MYLDPPTVAWTPLMRKSNVKFFMESSPPALFKSMIKNTAEDSR